MDGRIKSGHDGVGAPYRRTSAYSGRGISCTLLGTS